ncbi:hypothetical protein B0H11DRAFT_1919402 [Mycena galericulata]|nr:hypothetical protein B0H11DRAFT_1919402 [Mycena galericulata]
MSPSLPDANVTLQFYGTAVYLYGSANGSYDVTLDNTVHSFSPSNTIHSVSPSNGLLYSNDELIKEDHFVTLTAKPSNKSQLMAFGYAIVSTVDQSMPKETFYDNSNSNLTYFGQWSNNTVDGIPNSTVTVPFHQTLDAGSGFTMNFTETVAIALYASTNFGHELYSVSLDNGSPQIYNASTNWLIANTVIFFQSGLDPDRRHTINATNITPGGAKLTLSSVTTYQLDVSPTISSSSTPTIIVGAPIPSSAPISSNAHAEIGEIVGTIVGFLSFTLVGTIFWLRSRRARRKDYAGTISPLVLDSSRPIGQGTGTSSEMIEAVLPPPPSSGKNALRTQTTIFAQPPVVAVAPPLSRTSSVLQHTPQISLRSLASPADVNHIIELIAQRIDRRDDNQGSGHTLPPDYRVVSA